MYCRRISNLLDDDVYEISLFQQDRSHLTILDPLFLVEGPSDLSGRCNFGFLRKCRLGSEYVAIPRSPHTPQSDRRDESRYRGKTECQSRQRVD